ncbi:ABC transporter permease [Ramlibacter tataouinensis]|uniref:ABC transporter permease n=1 Tax=Ramlibacter tataouinensis TaxID=94132 RepID=UPI0022F3C358|nr:ABC transporter permease [Ramlibacter tataouinensis]WBY00716.1 ABC transporter permease [Ramlibacter tataouinensis]
MTLFGFDRRDAATVWNFFRMFLRDRFLGSRLGTVWAVLNPVLMLTTYTFVFGFVFKAKLPGADTTLAYATWLIAGYGPWLAISESLNSAAQSVTGNSGLVKNMAFKTECLPLASSMLGLVPLSISIVFALVLLTVDGNAPTWHALAAIPGVLLSFAFLAALGVGLAVFTVFVRDFALILPNLLLILLFASPIFYPVEAMPSLLKNVAQWNPFFLMAEFVRQPLMFHVVPHWSQWTYVAALTALIGSFNLILFRRLKGSLSSLL